MISSHFLFRFLSIVVAVLAVSDVIVWARVVRAPGNQRNSLLVGAVIMTIGMLALALALLTSKGSV